jgi:hypothetical protein
MFHCVSAVLAKRGSVHATALVLLAVQALFE